MAAVQETLRERKLYEHEIGQVTQSLRKKTTDKWGEIMQGALLRGTDTEKTDIGQLHPSVIDWIREDQIEEIKRKT